MKYMISFFCLIITIAIEFMLYKFLKIKNTKNKDTLVFGFLFALLCMLIWCISLVFQILIINYTTFNPIYIDYIVYICITFLPVAFYYIAYTFSNKKAPTKKSIILLSIVPIITILVLYTNPIHKLFYKVYSENTADTIFGPYFYFHSIYTYTLLLIDIIMLIKASIKYFQGLSFQTFLIILGVLPPIIINLLGITRIISMSKYATPTTFIATILCWSLAIFKYNFTPIALKTVVNQMSDSYIVLNNDSVVLDCNKSFEDVFNLKKENIIGKDFSELNLDKKIEIENGNLHQNLENVKKNNKIIKINAKFVQVSKYFSIEINGIINNDECIGVLILFKDTTQHILDMKSLKENQSRLMEKERLASLGQMIGRSRT